MMNIEEFRKIKSEILHIIDLSEDGTINDDNYIEYIEKHNNLYKTLFSNDLSQIPFEEWEQLFIYAPEDIEVLDLSNTHANIDFRIVEIECSKVDLRGCNLRNLEYCKYLDDLIVDDDLKDKYPKLFDLSALDESLVKSIRNSNVTFKTVDEHPEIIEYLTPVSFRSFDLNNKFVNFFGLQNALKFFNEYKKFIFELTEGFSSDREGWNDFFQNLESAENLSYEDAKGLFFQKIYEFVTSQGYLSCINEEYMPSEFFEKYPDIYLDSSKCYSLAHEYYGGRLSLRTYRSDSHFLEGKNLYRGISNYSILSKIKDLDAYYKEFPYPVDSILDSSYWIINRENIELNNNEDIKKYLPILANKLLEDKIDSWFPYRLGELFALRKYLPGVELKLKGNYNTQTTITDMDISLDILEEFDNKYPTLLDSYSRLSDRFITRFTEYLIISKKRSIQTYDEFEATVKSFILQELNSKYSCIGELCKCQAANLSAILPDRFLNENDYAKIDEIVKRLELSPDSIERYVQGAMRGEYNSFRYLYVSCPEIIDIIKDRITSFTFEEYDGRISYIYNQVSFNKFMELLDIYGLDVISKICSYSRDFYDNLYKTNDDSICDFIDELIYKDMIGLHIFDLSKLPDSFKTNYSRVYLPEDAPDDLKEIYYHIDEYDRFNASNQSFNFKLFHDHPEWKPYLKQIDFLHTASYKSLEFFNRLLKNFSEDEVYDILFDYGHLIYDKIDKFYFGYNFTKEQLRDLIINKIGELIITADCSALGLPDEFKNKFPEVYLPEDAPQELKDKFYSKTLSIYDLVKNPNYLSYFDNTILGVGFKPEYSWVTETYSDDNSKQFKVLSALEQIGDASLEQFLKTYIINNKDTFDVNKIDMFVKILSRLSYSNSAEIYNFRNTLAPQLLNVESPMEALDNIESLFIRNNIPVVGKIYGAFKVLHPELQGFNFNKGSRLSPQLLNRTTRGKEIMIFSDLIKCAAGSNNKSLKDYLESLRLGNKIYEDICNGLYTYETLNDKDKDIIDVFYSHLHMLYLNTAVGKKNDISLGTDTVQNISRLKLLLSPNAGMNYNLADRAVEMFCHFAGFDTVESLQNYMSKKIALASVRNKSSDVLEEPVMLHEGDLVKGIGQVSYLGRILQNGSVAKEFLGPSAGSDATPLDTDLSLIISDCTIERGIGTSISNSYGPIYFVLRGDDRFIDSRPKGNDIETKYDPNKYECFSTLSDTHYGIRTGFASSDINYIVVKDTMDEKIPLEIVMNGFYIPVVDFKGKVLFSPIDYDRLKNKMQGLSYYDMNGYDFSNNLVTLETEEIASEVEDNNKKTKYKRLRIEKTVSEVLKEFNLTLKTKIDGDLTESFAELIDTGSTSRGTNKIGEGDFDFMLCLDRSLIADRIKLDKLKQAFINKFESYGEIESKEMTAGGDFRFKGVTIEDVKVDIDMSFTVKTDKITYSTDRCLQDRLETIEKEDPIKYKYVCANIIYAKKILKEAGCYKSSHSVPPQGGLGGVGIENWILQNGGSFEDAARSFLTASENTSFEEFKEKYKVFDFGENHFSAKNGVYPHDNFVRNNMDASGYKLMVETLKNYFNRSIKNEDEFIETTETGRSM